MNIQPSFDRAFPQFWGKKQNQSAPIGTPFPSHFQGHDVVIGKNIFTVAKANSSLSSYRPIAAAHGLFTGGQAAAAGLFKSGEGEGEEEETGVFKPAFANRITVYEKAALIQRGGGGAGLSTPVLDGDKESVSSGDSPKQHFSVFSTPEFSACVKGPTWVSRKPPPVPQEKKKGTAPPPTEGETRWKARACYFKHLLEDTRNNMGYRLSYFKKKASDNGALYSSCVHLLDMQTQNLERVQKENDRLAGLIAVYYPKAEDYNNLMAYSKRLEEEKRVHEDERARMQAVIDSMSSSLNTFIRKDIENGGAVSAPEQFCSAFFSARPCDGPDADPASVSHSSSWF